MKTALYPGSFNPWHKGHSDILMKACSLFDIVIVCQMFNPEKAPPVQLRPADIDPGTTWKNWEIHQYNGLMVDAVKMYQCDFVVRGLRNGNDLDYEANLMYWNQELGLKVPVVCFITEQHLSHISSSAMRALKGYEHRISPRY